MTEDAYRNHLLRGEFIPALQALSVLHPLSATPEENRGRVRLAILANDLACVERMKELEAQGEREKLADLKSSNPRLFRPGR